MTYQYQENSLHAGQPVELYRFALGTTVWRYTSARDAVTYNAEKYIPAPIRRSEIEQTQEFGRAMLNLEAALDIGVVQSFGACWTRCLSRIRLAPACTSSKVDSSTTRPST
ncbi:hypothetical protein [Ralstonia mannitolilytica]|uniref:hypothetical protein n=1 Tax=Ralstonia mannitolilytica TaxID=105219 RepID=UPI0028F54463|nr:hypothetical protein [Ralstonia mannitolilytica]CAJ0727881.1 hypothetical protein R76706_01511 [Ralstonia mannitolilytica]